MNDAAAALRRIAADMCPGEPEMLAQKHREKSFILHLARHRRPVDRQADHAASLYRCSPAPNRAASFRCGGLRSRSCTGVAGMSMVSGPQLRQGVLDRTHDHSGRRRRAALPARLHAEWIGRRQHLGDFGLERRQIVEPRHPVVHQRSGDRLSGRRIDRAVLPERLPHALGDAAMGLPVHDQRIDAAADVIDRRVALDVHASGLRIDLDFAEHRCRWETPACASRCRDEREGRRPTRAAGRPDRPVARALTKSTPDCCRSR